MHLIMSIYGHKSWSSPIINDYFDNSLLITHQLLLHFMDHLLVMSGVSEEVLSFCHSEGALCMIIPEFSNLEIWLNCGKSSSELENESVNSFMVPIISDVILHVSYLYQFD